MAIKPGDTVRFLNTTGGGTVTRIEANMAYVADEDGFETPVLTREIVVVASPAQPDKATSHQSKQTAAPSYASKAPHTPASEPKTADIVETKSGDVMNLVLAFEASDPLHLSSSTFPAYLVNDSNYFIQFAILKREKSDSVWTLLKAGTLEPNFELLVAEPAPEDLPYLDCLAIQLIAYKESKPFSLIKPLNIEIPLDTTKFFKTHCYRSNPYFDHNVIAFNLVTDGVALRNERKSEAETALKTLAQKLRADRPSRRPVAKKNERKPGGDGIIEVDLHINELIDNTAGLSPADILNYQVDEFRRVMDENLKNHGQKIIFIHGKGEGVLRQALMKELSYRYKGHDVSDASFAAYGYGATQVKIR